MNRFAFTLIFLSASVAFGQGVQAVIPAGAQPPDEIRTVHLSVRPAAVPPAALKYELLPPLPDCHPGNAAMGYQKAILLYLQPGHETKDEQITAWLDLPLEKFPKAEAKRTVASAQSVLDELDRAARCDQCDWDLPLHDQKSALTLLFPELGRIRTLARLVSLQARLQIVDGKFKEAVHTLQTGFAMGRHASQGKLLVHGLVGIAICQLMSARAEELLQLPDAPNLYWTFTMLSPLIDLRSNVEAEACFRQMAMPFLRDLDESRNDPAYWLGIIDKCEETLNGLGVATTPAAGWRPIIAMYAVMKYPEARQLLIDHGRTAGAVDAMPVPKVIVLAALEQFDELIDSQLKWFFVPYWEAAEGMAEADRQVEATRREGKIMPLFSAVAIPVGSVRYTAARTDRNIAMLRTVEALRLYGAANQGHLPERLADIKEVPLPIDPVTGKPVAYVKIGEMAVLECPAPAGRPRNQGVRMEVRFK